MDTAEIKRRFTYQLLDKSQSDKVKNLSVNLMNVALLIDELIPDSRQKSLAITALETAMFWCISGIAETK